MENESSKWLNTQIEKVQELLSKGYTTNALEVALFVEDMGFEAEGRTLYDAIQESIKEDGEDWGVPEDDSPSYEDIERENCKHINNKSDEI